VTTCKSLHCSRARMLDAIGQLVGFLSYSREKKQTRRSRTDLEPSHLLIWSQAKHLVHCVSCDEVWTHVASIGQGGVRAPGWTHRPPNFFPSITPQVVVCIAAPDWHSPTLVLFVGAHRRCPIVELLCTTCSPALRAAHDQRDCHAPSHGISA